MKKKSNFVFKQRRSDLPSVVAAYHAERYAKHMLDLTVAFNKFTGGLFGYTIKCPSVKDELRSIWDTYSNQNY